MMRTIVLSISQTSSEVLLPHIELYGSDQPHQCDRSLPRVPDDIRPDDAEVIRVRF